MVNNLDPLNQKHLVHEYLVAEKKKWLGRLCAELDYCNPSMEEVTKHLERHQELFKKFNDNEKQKVREIIVSYTKKHKFSKNKTERLENLIAKLIITEEPIEVSKTQTVKAQEAQTSKAPNICKSLKGIDDKLFGFIHGDTLIKASGLEGGDSVKNIKFLLPYIETKRPFKNTSAIVSILKKLVETEKSKPILPDHTDLDHTDYFYFYLNLHKHSTLIAEKAEILKPGEKLLLRGGWTTTEGGGHAMLYLVEKTSDGNYAFTVINTGAGLPYHESKQIDFKKKHKPLIRFKNVDKDCITSHNFYQSLQEIKHIPTKQDTTPYRHDADDIYSRILPNLGGIRDRSFEKDVDFITAQRSGTCSWKSIMKLLLIESKDIQDYKKFIFDLRFDSLLTFYIRLKNGELESTDDRIQLLKRCTENFVRSVTKLHKKGIVQDSELEKVKKITKSISETVKQLEQTPSIQHPDLKFNESYTFLEVIPCEIFATHHPQESVVRETRRAEMVTLPPLDKLPEDLDTLTKTLDGIASCCQKLQNKKLYRSNLKYIENLFELIPPVGLGKDNFWNRISKGQNSDLIETAMGHIQKISNAYFASLPYIPEKERGSPDHFSVMLTLVAINSMLSMNLEDKRNPFKDFYIDFAAFSKYWEINSYAIPESSQLRVHLIKSKAYFDEELVNRGTGSIDNVLFSFLNVISYPYKFKFLQQGIPFLNEHKRLLQQPDLVSKIKSKYPKPTGASDRNIIKHAYENFESLLPKFYSILLEQKVVFDYFFRNPHLKKFRPGTDSQQGLVKFMCFWEKDEDLNFIIRIKDVYPYFTNPFLCDIEKGVLFIDNHPKPHLKGIGEILINEIINFNFKKFNCCEFCREIKKWGNGNFSKRSTSAEATIRKAASGLERRETQELAYMLSNKKFLVPNLISYFEAHPDRLIERDYQLFLYHSLFSGDHFEKSIKSCSSLAPKVIKFITSNYRLQKKIGNTQAALFLIWQAEILTSILPSLKTGISIQKELHSLVNSIYDTSFEGKRLKALARVQLIASYKDTKEFSEEEMVELAKAFATVKVYGFDQYLSHPYIARKMHDTMDRVIDKIQKSSDEKQQKIVHAITEEALNRKDCIWEGKKSLYNDSNSDLRVDLNTLSFYKGKDLIGSLPQEILEDSQFQTLFENINIVTTCPKPGLFQFSIEDPITSHKSEFRLFFSKTDGLLKVLKCFDDKWYTFVPRNEIRKFLSVTCLIDDHHHWLANGECTAAHLKIENAKDKKVVSLIDLKFQFQFLYDQYVVQEWRRDDGVPLQNVAGRKTPFDQLFSFQPKGEILVWGEKILEFPTLGIHFDIEKSQKAIFSENRDFYLAKQVPPKTLPMFKGYLTIENDQKEKKIVIPREPLQLTKLKPGPFQRNIVISHQKADGKYFVFDELKGKLRGKNVEENLYLAYLHLAHKNYEQAYTYLDQIRAGNPLGYSQAESEIMSWITDLMEQSSDSSPEAIEIGLQVLYLQLRNQAPKAEEDFKKILTTQISKYFVKHLKLSQHAKLFKVTPAQELELIDFLSVKPPEIKARFFQLKGIAKPEIPAQKTFEHKPEKIKSGAIKTMIRSMNSLLRSIKQKAIHAPYPRFLEGETTLAKELSSFIKNVASEEKNIRKKCALVLGLLKFDNESSLKPLRDMLLKVAEKGTPETRKRINQHIGSGNASDISFLKLLEEICEELNVEGVKAKPKTPSVKEEEKVSKVITKNKIRKTAPKFNNSETFIFQPLSIPKWLEENKCELKEAKLYESPVDSKDLKEVLAAPDGSSKVVEKEFKRVQESISKNDEVLNAAKKYMLDDSQIKKMSVLFDEKISSLKTTMDTEKEEILKLANKLSSDPIKGVVYELKLLGKKKKTFTIDDLIILYLQNNGAALIKNNPALIQDDVTKLTDLLTQYLIHSTQVNHLENLSSICQKTIPETNQEKKSKHLMDLNNTIREKRRYNPKKENTMLVFEHYSEMRLRKKQVDTIRAMSLVDTRERKNLVTQLIMGSGKSKVILPLLAFMNSHGNNVPFIIVPDQLYETNIADMRILSGELLNQEIETISINDNARLTLDQLDRILNKLNRVKENRSYCLMKATSVHSLRLHFKEAVKELQQSNEKTAAERYTKLKNILNILASQGDAIIDEADLVLDCLKEVNFSSGKRLPVTEGTQNMLESMFKEIYNEKKLREFFKLEKESESKFNEEDYKKIKPILAGKVMTLSKCGKHDKNTQDQIKKYLLSDSTLKEIPEIFQKFDCNTKNQLALGKELIKNLFSLVLKKNCDEHYGLSRKTSSNIAIPYSRSNTPSEGSEFGSPYETMLYTMLYYTRRGIKDDQVKRIITECKAQAVSQHKAYGTPLEKTEGYKRFEKLSLMPNRDLFSFKDYDIPEAIMEFNKNIEKKIHFAREYGWSEIGIYTERLTSTAQHLVGMFRSVQGFTGTLWNKDTFHKDLQASPDNAIDGKTLNILYNSKPIVKTYPDDLKKFYKGLQGYHACIDAGAWFRGVDAIDVAKNMLKHLDPKKIKGLVYFNDKDIPPGTKGRAVILERGKESEGPKLLENSELKPEERFTYYNVTTGADIVQADLAKAMTTISKNVTLRDLLQAVWRMRGLDAKQQVDFALPKELSDNIGGANIENIFRMCTMNQALRQQQDNLRALKQQISFTIDSIIEKVLLDPKISIEKAISIAEDAEEFIIQRISENPFELFGDVDIEKPTRKVMDAYIKYTLSQFNDDVYKKHNENFKKVCIWNEMEETMNKLVDYELLPEKIIDQKGETYGSENQVRKQVKTEQKTKTKINVNIVEKTRYSNLLVNCRSGWEFMENRGLFSNDYWNRLDGPSISSVNDYMRIYSGKITKIGRKGIFSKDLGMTKNFGSLYPYASPFQSGSNPVGICALRMTEEGKIFMDFLEAIEAEFLARMLEYDKYFDERTVKTANLLKEEMKKEKIKILNPMFKKIREKTKKASGRTLEELCREQYIEFIENELMKIDGYSTFILCKLIRDEYKFFDYCLMTKLIDDVNKELELIEEKYRWKPGLTYHQAIGYFNNNRDFRLALVDPQVGIVMQGKHPFDEGELNNNPKYIELITQAKFYKGILYDYKPKERAYLKSWIKKVGPERMEQLLLNNILSVKFKDQKAYEGSVIHKIIEEIK